MLKKQHTDLYVIEVEIGQETNGTYYAIAKDVPGLGAWGQTEAEARDNLAQGAVMYLRACFEHGDPLPRGIQQGHPQAAPVVPTYQRTDGHERLVFSIEANAPLL